MRAIATALLLLSSTLTASAQASPKPDSEQDVATVACLSAKGERENLTLRFIDFKHFQPKAFGTYTSRILAVEKSITQSGARTRIWQDHEIVFRSRTESEQWFGSLLCGSKHGEILALTAHFDFRGISLSVFEVSQDTMIAALFPTEKMLSNIDFNPPGRPKPIAKAVWDRISDGCSISGWDSYIEGDVLRIVFHIAESWCKDRQVVFNLLDGAVNAVPGSWKRVSR